MISYSKNKSLEFRNNSKTILAYTLNNDGKSPEQADGIIDENDLLVDIFKNLLFREFFLTFLTQYRLLFYILLKVSCLNKFFHLAIFLFLRK